MILYCDQSNLSLEKRQQEHEEIWRKLDDVHLSHTQKQLLQQTSSCLQQTQSNSLNKSKPVK
jgi:hypothetical protein